MVSMSNAELCKEGILKLKLYCTVLHVYKGLNIAILYDPEN